ncbi:MAG: glycosyltransferase family 39 protein [Terracidiphilus sp.]
MMSSRRWFYGMWAVLIGGFAVLHAMHFSADFPNHTPWFSDWAKYTDEGWYGNAAVRAHLLGNWYMPGDFNPAAALPVLPFLEWVLFFFTGVSIEAARGLAVAFFFANLLLSYLLVRLSGPRWAALLAVTLLVTSPFLYCFSRLAILEPLLTTLTLGALNLAVRLPRMRRPLWAAAGVGLIFTLMMLTKTTAIFLLPALGWALLLPLWKEKKLALRCAAAAAGVFTATFGLWMALVTGFGLLPDYKYLFFVNKYIKPPEFYWPLLSVWWSFHGGLWVDHVLVPLAGLLALGALVLWRRSFGRRMLLDPVFGASVLAVGGYIFFMTIQNHPQPRYFAVVGYFSFIVLAQGAGALVSEAKRVNEKARRGACGPGRAVWVRWAGWTVIAVAAVTAAFNGVETANFAAHPEYTLVTAAQRLTRYVDQHPNGKRLLVSISGDEITMITHLPTLCDDFGTQDLASKLAKYQPGWYATWNDIDPGTLEDLHNRYSIEQVASFPAFDDPDRNVLVLFKLHPLPNGEDRDPDTQDLKVPLPGDKVDIPVE